MTGGEDVALLSKLLEPIDATRPHHVGQLVSWHGRIMVLAWGIIMPVAVLAARYFKITPRQNWPQQLDNPTWWHIHLKGQIAVVLLTLLGLAIVLMADHGLSSPPHRILGYCLIVLAIGQLVSGLLRGSKGGPTAPAPDGSLHGDHYDMTPRRLIFERWHKRLGYALIFMAMVTVLLGLWVANAPLWMVVLILSWWIALTMVALFLQFRVGAYDTYQAIWGPNPDLPGNRMNPQGWASRRPGDLDRIWFRKRTGK